MKTMETNDVRQKILKYETFVNDVLKNDLGKANKERDAVVEELAEYSQLKSAIDAIKGRSTSDESLKTMVDLGCNFYAEAKVTDPTHICVCVGYGFYAELTLDEALRFIDKKTKLLNVSLDRASKQVARTKAHIRFVLEGLREIQGISDQPVPSEFRDFYE